MEDRCQTSTNQGRPGIQSESWFVTQIAGELDILSPTGTYPSCQRWFLPVSATLLRSYRCAVSRDERHCAATLRVRQDERSS